MFKQWKSEIWGQKKSKILAEISDSKIGTNNILTETDVANEEIILLLSTKIVKKGETKINIKNNSVRILGQKQDVIITNAGH